MAYLETNMPKKRKWIWWILIAVVIVAVAITIGWLQEYRQGQPLPNPATSSIVQTEPTEEQSKPTFKYEELAEYQGDPTIEVNGGSTFFDPLEITVNSFERYSELDSLGRCGAAYACLSTDTMPTEEREGIGMIKPAGWHTVRYDDLIEDKYLYNRCHLIAFMLSGENANVQNLITGTRYLNVTGMLPYETKVAKYIERTGNHVMYRVTPIYVGDELLARGVLMEAYSVEDEGEGIQFNIFAYNVQPGIVIDYATGESQRAN